jgi:apolipoprotein N-acyltransferase
VRTRQLLSTPTFQLPFTAGLLLISLGLTFLSAAWLERALWAAFTLLFAWQLWGAWRSHAA